MFQAGDLLLYRSVSEESSLVVKSLKTDEEAVYKFIEQAGNVGVWQKTLKLKTKFQTKQLTKVTQILIQKGLVKVVQTIHGKNKKVFMLAGLEPSRDITGGLWYEGSEFNSDLVRLLQIDAFNFIQTKKFSSADDILDHIKLSGQLKIELRKEDVQNVINTLIYDGLIEGIQGGREVKYKSIHDETAYSSFSDIPCSTCPVFELCHDDGDINPKVCPYLTEWMEHDMDF